MPELENAYPDGWYVRVMFDELLDPAVETLTEIKDGDGVGTGTFEGSIADTHPVSLQCESVTGGGLVDVPYDGYYSPSGNAVTWPLGPSLVIKPNDPTLIATGKECQITLAETITDKDGNPVPADQRMPYKFKIAPITVTFIDPSDSGDDTDPTAVDALSLFEDNVTIQFNTEVDADSLCPDADLKNTAPADPDGGYGLCDNKIFEFSNESGTCDSTGNACKSMADCDTGAGDTLCGKGSCNKTGTACNKDDDCTDAADEHCDSVMAAQDDTEVYLVGPAKPIPTGVMGEFRFLAGAVLKDHCGAETTIEAASPDTNTSFKFVTNEFDLSRINIADGETSGAIKKPVLSFNNIVDEGSFVSADDYSIDPVPDSAGVASTGGGFLIVGNFQPETQYTLTLKAGAKVADFYGDEYTNDEEVVIKWTTAQIALTSTTGDNSTRVKATPTSAVGVSLGFNQAMDDTSFDEGTDFTVVNSTGTEETGMSVGVSGCTEEDTSCTVTITKDLAPGSYTFTLKKDAQLADVLGNAYTQAADKVIHFTVADAETPPATPSCL